MPDVITVALIAQVFTLAGTALTLFIVYNKLDKVKKTGEDIHVLVNSNMGMQLKVSAVALRRLADMTGNNEDAAASRLADQALKEHEAKQATVDAS